MVLEDIINLKGIGKVTLEEGDAKGSHVVSVEVLGNEALKVISAVSIYLAEQKRIEINSLKYDGSEGSIVIHYSDVECDVKEDSNKVKCPSVRSHPGHRSGVTSATIYDCRW